MGGVTGGILANLETSKTAQKIELQGLFPAFW